MDNVCLSAAHAKAIRAHEAFRAMGSSRGVRLVLAISLVALLTETRSVYAVPTKGQTSESGSEDKASSDSSESSPDSTSVEDDSKTELEIVAINDGAETSIDDKKGVAGSSSLPKKKVKKSDSSDNDEKSSSSDGQEEAKSSDGEEDAKSSDGEKKSDSSDR